MALLNRHAFSKLFGRRGASCSPKSETLASPCICLTHRLERLPEDIMFEIVSQMDSCRDVLDLCLTSSYFYSLLLKTLYRSVYLSTIEHYKSTLTFLARRPDLAACIQSLVLSKSPCKWAIKDKPPDESELWVMEMLEGMATTLYNLHEFVWDSRESTQSYILWLNLRLSCPHLRRIGIGISKASNVFHSSVYDFVNLISVSLTITERVYQIPDRLYDMLVIHNPNLEELTINANFRANLNFDLTRLFTGRWPKLRRLTLGGDSQGYFIPRSTIRLFFEAHPTLEALTLRHIRGVPIIFSLSDCHFVLPNLRCYSGTYRDLDILNPTLLTDLSLTSYPHGASKTPAVCQLLRTFTALTSLSIWLDFSQPPGNHYESFSTLLNSCPRLLQFNVICSSGNFKVKEISLALRHAPLLKSFVLTKVFKSSDEEMKRSAIRIAQSNPNIQSFELRYTTTSFWGLEEMVLRQIGIYEVSSRANGSPVKLYIYERDLRRPDRRCISRYMHELT